MNVAKYIPIHGCSYIETPKSIVCKGAVVNLKNNDNMCFIWAILSALRNSDVKSNFKDRKYSDMSCPVCCDPESTDSQQHLLVCPDLGEADLVSTGSRLYYDDQ